LAALALGPIAGCFTAPESCSDCNTGAGGVGSGTGGSHGAGGAIGTGGILGTGGATSAGGSSGTGGSGAGGAMSTGGTGMGGRGAGGSGAGGAGMGGTGMGGSGMGGSGMGGSGMGGAIDAALVAWYQLDDVSGTTAVDSSGHARNATLSAIGGGAAAFSTTHQVGTGSVNLTSSGQGVGGLITVPASLNAMGATTAITVACWVNVRSQRAWERIFDFGNSQTTGYMFLTTQQAATAPNSVRFAISTAGNAAEEVINMTTPATLSTGVWHHVAVTLAAGAPYTGTLYIDKAVAGTNTGMTLRPSNLGNTPNNWIGRSQFAVDPFFDGFIDDFRIYSRALSAPEIAALP
jgi:hypothetical protein